jgi:DNA repair protein RecN (Recombination protein N)
MHREQVLEALNTAYHTLNGDNDPVREAWSTLSRVADKIGEGADEAIGALDRATTEIAEAVNAIQTLSSDLEHSEHNLETIDDRLHALRTQARKHDCSVDELADIRERLAEQLNAIEHADDLLEEAAKAAQTAKDAYFKKAQEVSLQRKTAAEKLDALVAQELAPLKLERAKFVTDLAPLDEAEWTKHGIDRVRFLVATNPGSDPGPLNKIASGGEMSRFMLALKVVMAEVGEAGTLIFDEVDAGIGGSTADAVGERLAALAKSKQVLVVTHSPQVAARASHHYIVSKQGDETVTTTVTHLNEDQKRREEIARMLAGAEITTEARAAADKLLETGKAA